MCDLKATRSAAPPSDRNPTEYLTKHKLENLCDLDVAMLVLNGFLLREVQTMLSSSKLYTSLSLIEQIVGNKTQGMIRRQQANVRLNAHQSALAFQFAKALEFATEVFGIQALAEDWLCQPSRYFSGKTPLQLIANSIGFAVVERYLAQIHHGIYA